MSILRTIRFSLLIIVFGGFFSCDDLLKQGNIKNEKKTIDNLIVPANFDYSTFQEIDLELVAPDYLRNATFSIFAQSTGDDGLLLGRGGFNSNGKFINKYNIPSWCDSLFVVSEYVGLDPVVGFDLNSQTISYEYDSESTELKSESIPLKSIQANGLTAIGTYDNNGVPNYLVSPDVIDGSLMNDINISLPERQRLTETHPEYLDNGDQGNLHLVEDCDVWVTFVTEGAGYKNILGYYTYKEGEAPKSVDEIDELRVIFPNVSKPGHGGNLKPGSKVKLGRFNAGTVISWFLVADGWYRNSMRYPAKNVFFSQPGLNPEGPENKKQHNVLLWDENREMAILGFDDQNRTTMSDEDFNDAVFYATANPADAIDYNKLDEIDSPKDSDGDGVGDTRDDYPNDPNRAFDHFAPSAKEEATLAFEDLWPGKGDYDFNDLLVDYNFRKVANHENKVVEIFGSFTIRHIGASFSNGFGIEFPIAPSNIKIVDGGEIDENYITLKENKTEEGTDNAVIVICDNATKHVGDTINMRIEFTEPVDLVELGDSPFNPFIVIDGNRANEVHLADYPPTSKANPDNFGTLNDNSNLNTGRFYKTYNHLPWGICIAHPLEVVKEKVPIIDAYLKFAEWAESGGELYPDWYLDKPGYRNEENLVIKAVEE